MIIEDAVEFLRETPPLSHLSPRGLARLAGRAALDFYPAGTRVLGPGGAGQGFVLAVRKGCISRLGEEYREGSLVGWVEGEAWASEDAVCCLLPREALSEALEGRPELFDFLEEKLCPGVLEMGLAGLVRQIPERLARRPLASVTAGEAARPGDPLPPGTTLREAARIMTETRRDAVVVLSNEGRPAGLVTDLDFRSRAALQGLSPDTPVERVMSSPVVSIDAGASCFEALMAMTRHHIRHVVVMAGQRPGGVLSAQELLLRQVGSPPALAALASQAATGEELGRVAALLDPLALTLLREGAMGSELSRIVGGLRETLVASACRLAEEGLGPAPGSFAVMLLGAAARREGPAASPAWTAVVHEPGAAVSAWCLRLGERLAGHLRAMGMAPEQSRVPDASGPEWVAPAEAWKERLAGWLESGPPDPGFLDFRPVHGTLHLAEGLRTHLGGLARTLPCRLDGAEPLADSVRAWSLCRGVTRIGGVERAKALERLCRLGPGLALAMDYLAARGWAGGPRASTPLGRAMERMCRRQAGRTHDALMATA